MQINKIRATQTDLNNLRKAKEIFRMLCEAKVFQDQQPETIGEYFSVAERHITDNLPKARKPK